jgi:hypothetical protein
MNRKAHAKDLGQEMLGTAERQQDESGRNG